MWRSTGVGHGYKSRAKFCMLCRSPFFLASLLPPPEIMAIEGYRAFIKKHFPDVRHEVDNVADVNRALGFQPSQFIIDGCVILRIIWAIGHFGSKFADLNAGGLVAFLLHLVERMLLFVDAFLDPRVKWIWVFDGPNREGPKARWDPSRGAANLNTAYRLLYLSTRHGAVGQGRELLDKNVLPEFLVINGVAFFMNQAMESRRNGSFARLPGKEADYAIAALCDELTVIASSDGDMEVFTKAAAVIMPQKS